MFRLADETTLERIEGSLLRARNFQTSVSAWWWNAVGLLFVVVSMTMFLYFRVPPVPKVDIPFEPQVWYSAARNISSNQYDTQRQPIETGMPNYQPEYATV
jgi:hypothetical protein